LPQSGTYEKTLELWMREKGTEELCEIPAGFEEELYNYASEMRRQLRLSDRSALSSSLKSSELEVAKRMAESLFEIRFRKIVAMAMTDRQPERILNFEKKLFYGLQRLVSEHRDRIKSVSRELRISHGNADSRYDVVAFMQPFPKVIGEDLRSYGPFKQGDVATLPPENARSLAKRNVVRRVVLP